MNIDDPIIIARTAWATDELHDAIDAAPPGGKFDLVSLMVGVNDQYRSRTVAHFQEGFEAVLRRARTFAKKPARLVVLSIPDWGASPFADGRDRGRISREIDAYNAAARVVSDRHGARWLDVVPSSRRMADDRSLAVSDGLHPSAALYRVWAELALPLAMTALVRV